MGTGIETSILRTCKQVRDESIGVLYGQHLDFRCSAQGALAFLHDVSKNLQLIKSIEFTYRLKDLRVSGLDKSISCLSACRGQDWEFTRFVNCLVHKCEGVNHVKVQFDNDFWSDSTWRQIQGVGYKRCLTRPVFEKGPGHCLQQVARLSAYDAESVKYQVKRNGVRLEIDFGELASNPEEAQLQQKFVEAMNQAIKQQRALRPQTLARGRPCNCRTKVYKDCCYVKLPSGEVSA